MVLISKIGVIVTEGEFLNDVQIIFLFTHDSSYTLKPEKMELTSTRYNETRDNRAATLMVRRREAYNEISKLRV